MLADATRAGDTRPTERGNDSLVSALADSVTFNWALECVLSRAFQLPPDSATSLTFDDGDDAPTRAPEVEPPPPTEARMALLPLIDSMNHYSRMPTHMYWEADGAISVSGEQHSEVVCLSRGGFFSIVVELVFHAARTFWWLWHHQVPTQASFVYAWYYLVFVD